MKKIPVAVVGATGLAGQQFLTALAGHPELELVGLAASARSAGKRYAEALRDARGALQWFCQEPLPEEFAQMPLVAASELEPKAYGCIFTAIDAEPARELEPRYAAETPVISTASAFRYEEDVPVFIPGVNLDHARLIDVQRKKRGWRGFISPGPNCTTVGLAMTLAPLHAAFGVKRVIMTSLQSCSGAGRSPGVIALDILDNVVPFIPTEEEKVQIETRKILGAVAGDAITPAGFPVSVTCTRVAVLEGHTESVFVELARPATVEAAATAMRGFGAELVRQKLPSAPRHLILVHDDPFRPQPRLDRDAEDGMATTVGRLREDTALPNGLKYVLVSHNTKMGAAKGAVLTAEILRRAGYIGR
jgi:aspartate-semialdehyde dehydrogenase